jgi:hypothetical protein
LPITGIRYFIQLFHVVLLKGYFPAQWKVSQIILILQPGKPPNELISYWSISIFSIAAKVFEKLLLKRFLPVVENNGLICNHQFGFRQRHSTIEQALKLLKTRTTVLQHFYTSLNHSTKYSILNSYTS